MKTFEMKCKAFSNEGTKINTITVVAGGSVLVWDSVAMAYTSCHALSASAVARAVARALLGARA